MHHVTDRCSCPYSTRQTDLTGKYACCRRMATKPRPRHSKGRFHLLIHLVNFANGLLHSELQDNSETFHGSVYILYNLFKPYFYTYTYMSNSRRTNALRKQDSGTSDMRSNHANRTGEALPVAVSETFPALLPCLPEHLGHGVKT